MTFCSQPRSLSGGSVGESCSFQIIRHWWIVVSDSELGRRLETEARPVLDSSARGGTRAVELLFQSSPVAATYRITGCGTDRNGVGELGTVLEVVKATVKVIKWYSVVVVVEEEDLPPGGCFKQLWLQLCARDVVNILQGE